jgi:hypothetical protein
VGAENLCHQAIFRLSAVVGYEQGKLVKYSLFGHAEGPSVAPGWRGPGPLGGIAVTDPALGFDPAAAYPDTTGTWELYSGNPIFVLAGLTAATLLLTLDPYFWWYERYWKLMAPLAGMFNGTPFKGRSGACSASAPAGASSTTDAPSPNARW